MCPNNTAFHPIPSSQGNREPNPDQRLEQRRNDRTATFPHLFQNRLSQADLPCSHYCREISERWHLRHEDNATDILSPESCSIRIWSCAASISELKRAWICLPSAKRARLQSKIHARRNCKPDSVVDGHSSGPAVARRLMLPTRAARSRHPMCGPYLALLPVGLAMPVRLPVPRWALTPPFHPCPSTGRSVFCGAFPRVAPAGCYPAPLSCGVRTFLKVMKTPQPSAPPRNSFSRI